MTFANSGILRRMQEACSPYTITTESVADIVPALLGERNIRVLPMEYRIAGGQVQVDDGLPETGTTVCEALKAARSVSVAMAGAGRFTAFWTPELMRGRDILHLSLSARLGGTHDAAVIAAAGCKLRFPSRSIHVVDSLAVSGGLSLLVSRAAGYRADGMALDACRARIEQEKHGVQHLIAVHDLSRVIQSGRLLPDARTHSQGKHTVLSLDAAGALVRRKAFLDRLSALRFLRDAFLRTAEAGTEALIYHTDAAADAERLADLIARTAGAAVPKCLRPGAAIAANVGRGAVALFFLGRGRV